MGTITWGEDLASVYDSMVSSGFDPSVLEPTVDLLAELAGDGPALEFAVGTGRVALPLSRRGVEVHGIELSPHMAERMRAKAGAEAAPVTVGDMASTIVPGSFKLVYLVGNSIMNVTTQEEQIAVFSNAAAHLVPGGCFVLEIAIPQMRRVPPGENSRVFRLDPDHVGVETYEDVIEQISWSHHWMNFDGRLVRHSAPYRYVWPAELDLMARLTGFRRRDRWAGWERQPLLPESEGQVVVYEKLEMTDTTIT